MARLLIGRCAATWSAAARCEVTARPLALRASLVIAAVSQVALVHRQAALRLLPPQRCRRRPPRSHRPPKCRRTRRCAA